MIAGELKVFGANADDAEIDKASLIDLTEWGEYLELSFDVGRKRFYIRFRHSDLKREIKEQTS